MNVNKRLLRGLSLLLLAGKVSAAWGSGLSIMLAEFNSSETLGDLHLQMGININRTLEDAIDGGTELVFKAETKVMEKYWLLERERDHFSWHARIRRRGHGQGYEYQQFGTDTWQNSDSIDEALGQLGSLRIQFHDAIFLRNMRSNADLYLIHRVEVDLSNLPNPLQVDLLTSSEWSFSSGWQPSNQ